MSFGSRSTNKRFRPPEKFLLNGVETESKINNKQYYPLIDDDGTITVKRPTTQGDFAAQFGASGESVDVTVGTYAKDGSFNPNPLATPEERLYFSSVVGQSNTKNQAVLIVQKAGVPQQQARQLIFPNTATPGGTPGPAATPPIDGGVADIDAAPLENTSIAPDFQRTNFGDSNNLRYPAKLDLTRQDCIQFMMMTNEGRSLTGAPGIFGGLGARNQSTKIEGTVTLPIQSGITDSNGVEWGGASLDAKDAFLASLALGGITSDKGLGENAGGLIGRVFKELKDAATGGDENFRKAINLYLAQEAVGVQGLLSRASGAILNPNLELLFNGPSLRSFTFTFRLSPRSEPEAGNVRRIIRFFKEGMAVKTASKGVFLKSPNIFKIKYIPAGPAPAAGAEAPFHKSLPRIKECALLGCDVDYTPDGTYMTFNDGAKTMTSYQLSLRFGELDPLYSNDYENIPLDEIGY
jgi:hypothetical protein